MADENEVVRLQVFVMRMANRLADASEVLGMVAERRKKKHPAEVPGVDYDSEGRPYLTSRSA